jgi:bifunctional DNA-binding transcriptional regulator/antitoxin component of YhaV-PrlF toxin-antitoxin module
LQPFPKGIAMATRISAKGRVTLPRRVCEALRVGPGDSVQFAFNSSGEVVVHRAPPESRPPGRARDARHHARLEAQMRRRAAELLALLRGLD